MLTTLQKREVVPLQVFGDGRRQFVDVLVVDDAHDQHVGILP
jgi:hypothetical protein